MDRFTQTRYRFLFCNGLLISGALLLIAVSLWLLSAVAMPDPGRSFCRRSQDSQALDPGGCGPAVVPGDEEAELERGAGGDDPAGCHLASVDPVPERRVRFHRAGAVARQTAAGGQLPRSRASPPDWDSFPVHTPLV